MPLSDAHFEAVRQHLEAKTSSLCPMCRRRNWNVMGVAYDQMLGADLPVVLVRCNHCFFVAPYDAERMGVT